MLSSVILFGENFIVGNITGSIGVDMKVNLKFIQIAIISENSPGDINKLIKVFRSEFHKVHLNKLPKTVVLNIHYLVFINFVYDIFIEQIIVSFLNVEARFEENFEVVNL